MTNGAWLGGVMWLLVLLMALGALVMSILAWDRASAVRGRRGQKGTPGATGVTGAAGATGVTGSSSTVTGPTGYTGFSITGPTGATSTVPGGTGPTGVAGSGGGTGATGTTPGANVLYRAFDGAAQIIATPTLISFPTGTYDFMYGAWTTDVTYQHWYPPSTGVYFGTFTTTLRQLNTGIFQLSIHVDDPTAPGASLAEIDWIQNLTTVAGGSGNALPFSLSFMGTFSPTLPITVAINPSGTWSVEGPVLSVFQIFHTT